MPVYTGANIMLPLHTRAQTSAVSQGKLEAASRHGGKKGIGNQILTLSLNLNLSLNLSLIVIVPNLRFPAVIRRS